MSALDCTRTQREWRARCGPRFRVGRSGPKFVRRSRFRSRRVPLSSVEMSIERVGELDDAEVSFLSSLSDPGEQAI